MKFTRQNVSLVSWHPVELQLVTATIENDHTLNLCLLEVSAQQLRCIEQTTIAKPVEFGNPIAIKLHPRSSHILLICENGLLVLNDISGTLIGSTRLDRAIQNGGFYPDESLVWTLPTAASACVDWGVWRYDTNVYQEYELERYDHYGRGATLHPSGRLIGACWNAYASGYLIHRIASDNRMGYYANPAPERSEYEAYHPAFSADGALFAMICNPFLGGFRANLGRLCIYHIETAELIAEYSTKSKLGEIAIAFVQGSEKIAFCTSDRIVIHRVGANQHPTIMRCESPIHCFAGHPLRSAFAVVAKRELSVLIEDDRAINSAIDYLERNRAIADRFICDNEQQFYLVGSTEV